MYLQVILYNHVYCCQHDVLILRFAFSQQMCGGIEASVAVF